MLRRFRCVLGRESWGAIDNSLCKAYCALIHQYCDEGKLSEARQCLGECLREIRPSRHLPAIYLLNATARTVRPRPSPIVQAGVQSDAAQASRCRGIRHPCDPPLPLPRRRLHPLCPRASDRPVCLLPLSPRRAGYPALTR